MGRNVARTGEMGNPYKFLVGKTKGKRSLRRRTHRREDDIKMNLRAVGYDCLDWINRVQDRCQWRAVVNTVMDFRVP